MSGYYFFDSSALVKRYVRETGTQWVRALIDQSPPPEISIAHVTGAEVVAGITRRTRTGATSLIDAARAIGVFNTQFQTKYRVVIVTLEMVERAMSLAERHALRGYDSIQLATALAIEDELRANGIGPLILISADGDLNKAAQTEGLLTDNPNLHP